MTSPSVTRVTLLVLYTPQLEECRDFYTRLGLAFAAEQHGHGPAHTLLSSRMARSSSFIHRVLAGRPRPCDWDLLSRGET
jgi:catechol 2,3-dioxygenase-like lactoylglutathione lyase family enzyme